MRRHGEAIFPVFTESNKNATHEHIQDASIETIRLRVSFDCQEDAAGEKKM